MLDSLVRVSRRGDKRHFVKVPPTSDGTLNPHRFETSPARQRKPDLRTATRTPRMRDIQNDRTPTLPPIGSISAISGTV